MHPIPDDKYPPYLWEPRGYKWGSTSYPKEPVVEKSLSLLQQLQFFIYRYHPYFRFLVPLIYGLKKNKHELRKQGKRVNESSSVVLTTYKYCSQVLFLWQPITRANMQIDMQKFSYSSELRDTVQNHITSGLKDHQVFSVIAAPHFTSYQAKLGI